MGLNINSTKFLLYAKSLNVDFAKTATIGRQTLTLSPADLRKNLREFQLPVVEETIDSIFLKNDGYAEEFVRYLGANEVHSIDYSSYEGATNIHDMNQPIPDDYKSRYSVVLDGGSLEHVFNFPVAIKNCMEMVRVGGHYIGITPTNNFMGHGFYQISPECFFSVFTQDNGYEINRVIAFEDRLNAKWFSVKDPKAINSRVTLTNHVPTFLLVLAKRVSERPIFEAMPQQSDYVSTWTHATVVNRRAGRDSLITILKRKIPDSLKERIKPQLGRLAHRSRSLTYHLRPKFNRRFFEPVRLPTHLQPSKKA